MPKYMLIMRGTDESDAAMMADIDAMMATSPAQPHGCLGVQGALATGGSSRGARDLLVAGRDEGYRGIRDRFRRAVDDAALRHWPPF